MNKANDIDRRTFLRMLSGVLVSGAVAPLVAGCGGGAGAGAPGTSSSSGVSGSSGSSSSSGSGINHSSSSSTSSVSSLSSVSSVSSGSTSSISSSSSSSSSVASGFTVTGTIVDSSSLIVLAGYTVEIYGTMQTATSSATGAFSISGVTLTGAQVLNVYTGSTLVGSAAVTLAGTTGGTDALGTVDVVSALTPPPVPLKRKR